MNKSSEGAASAKRILGQYHHIDTHNLAHNETRTNDGAMQADLAMLDEDDGEPVGWAMEALILFLCGMGTMALVMFVIWGASIFARLG